MANPLLLLLSAVTASCATLPLRNASPQTFDLDVPSSPPAGASIEHSPSFSSISLEPAFWIEFVGTAKEPNALVLELFSRITERGGRPILRPGGITMDSMVFDPAGGDLERTMGPDGEIYRTTVGPGYFESWANFPDAVSFVSTLNFGNESLDIARDLAVASATYQGPRIGFFELGNEPNHFPGRRWKNSTQAYVDEWKNWTASIDEAVAAVSGQEQSQKWWASSATTDPSPLKIRPVDIIPKGVDSANQVGQFSLHSYVYSTCSAAAAAVATIENLLNHTRIVSFADAQVVPSAEAARAHGKPWVMGEFNSVACSGKINVTDTFTQALWIVDTQLAYAVRNASSVHLHQGGTLLLQSGGQTNTAGFSAYDFVYPRASDKHGPARVQPSFAALLVLAEVFATPGTRILPLPAPEGVDSHRFSAYAAYEEDRLAKLVLINMHPYYTNSTSDYSVSVNVLPHVRGGAYVKRLTAPFVDEKDAANVFWAGQSFKQGDAVGEVEIERLSEDGSVTIRGSEAVVLFLGDDVYGL